MPEETKSGEALVAEGEASTGRRRSARQLGKERPSYAFEKHTSVNEKRVVRKKPKLSPMRKATSEQPSSSSISREGGVKMNDNIKPVIISLDDGCSDMEGDKASAASQHASEKEHKLNSRDCGGALQTEGENDPQGVPVKSDRQRVKETLRIFNTYYLQQIQVS